jgi:tRNA G46 methylase TrmB
MIGYCFAVPSYNGLAVSAFQIHNRSKEIISSQQGVHPRLEEIVKKHLREPWRQPLHRASVKAFESAQAIVEKAGLPLVLDAGCGTGESSRRLAERHPESLVIGVDKSADRLAKTAGTSFPYREGRVLWLRADLTTFWRLADRAGWQLAHHYLLYPNPWPKSVHLQRRWHAHPVLPALLNLGGRLEMRCNWRVYADEFAQALRLGLTPGGQGVTLEEISPDRPVSPFEAKYRASGHRLYSVSTRLP